VGGWSANNPALSGANALAMDTAAPPGPVQKVTSATGSGQLLEAAQFLSPPLSAGQSLGGTYTIAYSWWNDAGTAQDTAWNYVGVINGGGQPVASIYGFYGLYGSGLPVGDYWAFAQTRTGSAYTTQAGDRLVLEIGATKPGYTPDSVAFAGTQPVQADGYMHENANPQAYLQVPVALSYLAPMTASPNSVAAPASQATITLSLRGASWQTNNPTFKIANSNGAKATIAGQSITSQTTATLTLDTNAHPGTVTITDPSTGISVPISLTGTWTLSASPSRSSAE
jgi:hypothetical protein